MSSLTSAIYERCPALTSDVSNKCAAVPLIHICDRCPPWPLLCLTGVPPDLCYICQVFFLTSAISDRCPTWPLLYLTGVLPDLRYIWQVFYLTSAMYNRCPPWPLLYLIGFPPDLLLIRVFHLTSAISDRCPHWPPRAWPLFYTSWQTSISHLFTTMSWAGGSNCGPILMFCGLGRNWSQSRHSAAGGWRTSLAVCWRTSLLAGVAASQERTS